MIRFQLTKRFLSALTISGIILLNYFLYRFVLPRSSYGISGVYDPNLHNGIPGQADNEDDSWCSQVAGQRYINDVASTWAMSCAPPEGATNASAMACFQAQIEESPDNFCVIRNALYGRAGIRGRSLDDDQEASSDVSITKRQEFAPWYASCKLSVDWQFGVQPVHKFRKYFSETGVMSQLEPWDMQPLKYPPADADCKDSIMLVKLEGGGNIWHTLMETWSAIITLDILKAADDAQRKLGLTAADWEPSNVGLYMENMDSEMRASPIFDLWNVVTGSPPLNRSDLAEKCYRSVILPFAGGANPFWKDHWKERGCKKSRLVDRFVEKVTGYYGVNGKKAVAAGSKRPNGKIVVTIIARKQNRKILKLYDFVKSLQRSYADAEINIHSFEKMNITQQLELVKGTDVLVGVTGAGLTHTLFLEEGSAVIELLQPEPFAYYGFRNLAGMKNLKYFALHGEYRGKDKNGGWQAENVLLEEKEFVEVVGQAIDTQRNR